MEHIYLIMVWDSEEEHPEGRAFKTEKEAEEYCAGSDGWLAYKEIDLC